MSNLGFTKKDNYTRCMNSALYSLAMREHSRFEIYNKLCKKDYVEGVDLQALLDKLEEKNYINEERFTESFVRYRVSRGQGPVKITSELRRKGVSSSLISQVMQDAEADWFDLATQQLEKKFGRAIPEDFKEKAKRMRFLSARGFDAEVVRAVVG